MPKKYLFLYIFLSGLGYSVYQHGDHWGEFWIVMFLVLIAAYVFSQLFGEKESEVNKGTLETNNNAFDLTTELAKLDKLKKDGLISAEDYEVLKKRAIEKAKE